MKDSELTLCDGYDLGEHRIWGGDQNMRSRGHDGHL